MVRLQGKQLVQGTACGQLLSSDVGISFWGGVDSVTGDVVDHHHPLHGQNVSGRIVAMPSSRGSCTGSIVMLELLLSGTAPAGLIFKQEEQILTLGVLVANAIFHVSIPVVVLAPDDFNLLIHSNAFVTIQGAEVYLSDEPWRLPHTSNAYSCINSTVEDVELSPRDRSILAGDEGPAAQVSLEVILSFAALQGAKKLLDVSQAHIDACIYTGPASLRFAQNLLGMGARCVVPTTLNAISIDRRRWNEIGVDPVLARQAEKLAQTYVSMGARSSFTCAPYLLETAPLVGEDIGWAESNAIVFANSVLGARTQKYPDLIDVCIALTGRAPLAGCHLAEGRLPTFRVIVMGLDALECDDSLYPLLGYLIGKLSQHRIPSICGLESLTPTMADLKAFSAAFGTTSSSAMFHMHGVTPDPLPPNEWMDQLPQVEIRHPDLVRCWHELNTATGSTVDLVSLGNPHFSVEEFCTLAGLSRGRKKTGSVSMIVTTSRDVERSADVAGHLKHLKDFGASIVTDTCWCMLREPAIASKVRNLMTNSAKYAHYAPGMVSRGVHFGGLAQCVEVACNGRAVGKPAWLLREDH